jgi:hypothetical protein
VVDIGSDAWLVRVGGAGLAAAGAGRDGLEAPFWAAEMGVERFVERFIISLPCTTRLSLDFFRSLVSISGEVGAQTSVSEFADPGTANGKVTYLLR